MSKKLLLALLIGGTVAGLLDIGMAALIYLLPPSVVMRGIAGGLMGAYDAQRVGMFPVIVGLALQLAMSVLIALIYGFASLRLPPLTRRWFSFGLLYGVVVFFVMNWIVAPLSAAHSHAGFRRPLYAVENLAAMLVFALIIAFAAHRGARKA